MNFTRNERTSDTISQSEKKQIDAKLEALASQVASLSSMLESTKGTVDGLLDGTGSTPLPVATGGTNAQDTGTARQNLLGDMDSLITPVTDDTEVICEVEEPNNGVIGKRKMSIFWTYLRGKIGAFFGLFAGRLETSNVITINETLTSLVDPDTEVVTSSQTVGYDDDGKLIPIRAQFDVPTGSHIDTSDTDSTPIADSIESVRNTADGLVSGTEKAHKAGTIDIKDSAATVRLVGSGATIGTSGDINTSENAPTVNLFNGKITGTITEADHATTSDTATNSPTYTELNAMKGASNGIASLDASGRIPFSQLPESAMEFKGSWNAFTNTPELAEGVGTLGDLYIVSVGGTQFGTTFAANDRVVYDGNVWSRLPAGEVNSVNNKASVGGNVTLYGGDIAMSSSDATTVKSAIDTKQTASQVNALISTAMSGITADNINTTGFWKGKAGSKKVYTCSTAGSTAAKTVTFDHTLAAGEVVTVLFQNKATGTTSPTLNGKTIVAYNGGGWEALKYHAINGTNAFWNDSIIVDLFFNGTYFFVLGNPVLYASYSELSNYEIYANGQVRQWAKASVSSGATTAKDFTFPVTFRSYVSNVEPMTVAGSSSVATGLSTNLINKVKNGTVSTTGVSIQYAYCSYVGYIAQGY